MVYNFFDQKMGLGASINKVIAQELDKPLIEQFKRRKM